MMRDLMLACFEARFGSLEARFCGLCASELQWQADNGSAYKAADTLSFAAALGLMLYLAPVRSPESSGVSEAFVKTLKRDHTRSSGPGHFQTETSPLPAVAYASGEGRVVL
ncbi:MAG: hypothetical protein PGN25_20685 [Methylorubrum populi]